MGLWTLTQFHTLIRIMHGVHMKMIAKTKWQGCIDFTKITNSRDQFAVH